MAEIIVFGEILWDCLPSGPRLGGAPLNAAANLSLLGHEVFLVSAVGKDYFGDQALDALGKYGVKTDYVMQAGYTTGTVEVELDEQGDASYRFTQDCAWHHMGELLKDKTLPQGDALLYGSLANHTPENWSWLESQLPHFSGIKFCDINLREPWDLETVQSIAKTACILKCNKSEYEALTGTEADISDTSLLKTVREQDPEFPANLCITFGKEGALYFSEKNEIYSGTTNAVEVVDSIGAGDAFMAGLMHQVITSEQEPPLDFLNICCQLGAEAASRSGALPELD
jgi:fructokinase